MESKKGIPIQLKRILPPGSKPPKPANTFVWARFDGTYHLETGYYDALSYGKLLEALAGEGISDEVETLNPSLESFVTDRFILTPKDVLELYRAVSVMFNDAVEAGLIQEAGSQD
jgi:hypothetical protein